MEWTKTTKWIHGENYDLPDGFDDGETCFFFPREGWKSHAIFNKGVFLTDEDGNPHPQGIYKDHKDITNVLYENLSERTKHFFDQKNTGQSWFRG